MTAACPGGVASQPKAGVDVVITYTAGALALLLQSRGGAKLIPVIPLLGIAPLVVGNFCTADPPAMPTITQAEVDAVLKLTPGADFLSGIGKLRDMVLRMIWYEVCECTAGAPTPFVNPVLPPGTANPILPTLPSASPCGTFPDNPNGMGAVFGVDPGAVQNAIQFNDVGGHQIGPEVLTPPGTAVPQYKDFAIPFGTTRITIDQATGYLFVGDVTPTPIPSTATLMRTRNYIEHRISDNTWRTHLLVEVYCGNGPGERPTPCCPPDASTQAYLDTILQMITLVQRQSAPFAYVYGANHAALSGHGSFAVNGLIGVSVDVTTLPASYGRAEGSPETLFDIGFVTLGTADGYEVSRRIDHDGSLVMPPLAGVFTAVGYTLSPGVQVAIRELVREP